MTNCIAFTSTENLGNENGYNQGDSFLVTYCALGNGPGGHLSGEMLEVGGIAVMACVCYAEHYGYQ